MKITKLSNNFTPLRKGIFFNIDTEESAPKNIIVEIIDLISSEVIATQQLREVTSAEVNIAPYLARLEDNRPMQSFCTAFSEAPYARYKIRVDNTESEAVTVSINNIEIGDMPTIISTMPNSRRISYGEGDEVLIISGKKSTICAKITSDTGECINLEHHTTIGANVLTVSTENFDTEIRSLEVVLSCDNKVFGTLHYRVSPPIKTATRLAWLSDKGSIERYSFPITHKVKNEVEKRTIITTEGVQSVHCRTKQKLSLASRFEPSDTISALAQIASSTKVWIERGRELERAEVTTLSVEQNLFNKPDCLCIDICTLNEEERIW